MLLNYLAYGFLIALYALFAWFGKAPVEGFLTALGMGLAALGTHHAITSASKRATDAANYANPVPPQQPTAAPTTVSNQ